MKRYINFIFFHIKQTSVSFFYLLEVHSELVIRSQAFVAIPFKLPIARKLQTPPLQFPSTMGLHFSPKRVKDAKKSIWRGTLASMLSLRLRVLISI